MVSCGLFALTPVNALAFHNYSIATDNYWRSGNTYYSGVSVQRYDSTFNLAYNANCSTAPTGPVIYQTMWLLMDPTAGTWLELGTGHKTCSYGYEFKWWFAWMSNPNGFSGYLWTQQISGSAIHRFFISNGTDGYWRWVIDYTQEYAYHWQNLGMYAQAGTESYDSSANAPSHDYSGMVIQHNWSTWTDWTPTSFAGPTCKPLTPPSNWCVFDSDVPQNLKLNGNYYSNNTSGWASEP